ncbi:hypothetical protein BN2476_570040 [Paraburkholderia piptadeniae]|uniref:Uncharacterized protein n=1 Tax=Paraburkholderia piptadeniae TaxID=1701573 RepID=A0A1N7SJI1_9BURK|nr:hypothetical protein BN2476_570040 [Paraburkholderia piptadeniae]
MPAIPAMRCSDKRHRRVGGSSGSHCSYRCRLFKRDKPAPFSSYCSLISEWFAAGEAHAAALDIARAARVKTKTKTHDAEDIGRPRVQSSRGSRDRLCA